METEVVCTNCNVEYVIQTVTDDVLEIKYCSMCGSVVEVCDYNNFGKIKTIG